MPKLDTSTVTDRRPLRFASPGEVLADLDALVRAHRAGTLRTAGNWTAGQVLGHLAAWIDYAYHGYPMKTPMFVRLLGTFMKKKFLNSPMPAGYKLPKADTGTYGVEDLSFEQGELILRRAWERLAKDPPRLPNPVFGPMTHEDWIRLHLRHAELHLSFLHPA